MNLTDDQKTALIERLIDHYESMDKFTDGFRRLFGGHPSDGEFSFVESMFNDYAKLVADLIGDTEESMEWFVWENDCGKKGLEAGTDKEMRQIVTIEDYLWLITAK